VNTDRPLVNRQPMLKIDGSKVRELRESLELTQLYLATAVGVTTDTISRWENRRYPRIKKENAAKLAKALEVPLSAILEDQGAETLGKDTGERQEKIAKAKITSLPESLTCLPLLALILICMAIVCGVFWWSFFGHQKVYLTVHRFLPLHVAPGQSFPVIIKVKTGHTGSLSVILRESLPKNCTPLKAEPPFTAINNKTNNLKWIYQTDGQKIIFCYLATINPATKMGEKLHFEGTITARKGRGATIPIKALDTLEVRPLHWADTNGDGKIDDEEILTVYDELGEIKEINFGIKRIEDIWSGNGYRWDKQSKKFVILP